MPTLDRTGRGGIELADEELLDEALGPAVDGRFLLTFGGKTYLQISPLVLHSEQASSFASLVQHIFLFLQASHLRFLS